MEPYEPTHVHTLLRPEETKVMLFVCFTKALLKIIIHTYCNNLNKLNYRKIKK